VHLVVVDGSVRLETGAKVEYSLPSVDVLFSSVARVCADRVLPLHDIPAGLVRLALLRVMPVLETEEAATDGDERTGLQILRRALQAPARQIAENSAVDGGVVVELMRSSEGDIGFDAARREYVDLVANDIIDPTKVVRGVALENAVSAASLLLLTEAVLTEVPEKKEERAAGID
jgi:chaperonin GroEL